jgi:APA family basic amino acid/polyamine antiporter
MIGTGVFLKPAIMAAEVGSVAMVLAAWLFAGLLSLAGALTYGELTSRMPAAGGEYAILRSVYGEFPAYLYGWMRFTIGAPGSAASYAVGAATFLHVAYPYETHGLRVWQVAVIFVAFFTLINTLTILVSSSVQVLLTGIKVASLFAIVVALIFFTPAHTGVNPPAAWPRHGLVFGGPDGCPLGL